MNKYFRLSHSETSATIIPFTNISVIVMLKEMYQIHLKTHFNNTNFINVSKSPEIDQTYQDFLTWINQS